MPPEIAVGSTFAGHRIDAVAGRGGMATVYRATDLALDRSVALKVITPRLAADPVFRERFERECRAAAAIEHPHVVQVFHAGEEDGLLYVTMRYVDGTDLATLLRAETRLEPSRAVRLVAQVAGALDAAHRRGLVHRDVKPANVLIAHHDGEEHAFLTDFGLTKQREETALTRPGFAMGTADYMAPEQAKGEDVDARTDVYGLGCVLFQALSGAAPFQKGTDLDKMWAHVHHPPPWLLDACPAHPPLPRALAEAVHRALAKDPGERQRSASWRAICWGRWRRAPRVPRCRPPRPAPRRCASWSPRTRCCCAPASCGCSSTPASRSSPRPGTGRSCCGRRASTVPTSW
jgi:serine/threonine protein kinase